MKVTTEHPARVPYSKEQLIETDYVTIRTKSGQEFRIREAAGTLEVTRLTKHEQVFKEA